MLLVFGIADVSGFVWVCLGDALSCSWALILLIGFVIDALRWCFVGGFILEIVCGFGGLQFGFVRFVVGMIRLL